MTLGANCQRTRCGPRTRSSGSTLCRFLRHGHVRYVPAQVSVIANTSSAGKRQEVLVDEDAPEDADEHGIVDEAKRHHRWDTQAAAVIERLVRECGLTATTVCSDGSPGPVAMARNRDRPWFTAVLWNPATVTPVPGGFRPYGSPDYWHGFTTIQLDIGGRAPLLTASYHGDPFRPAPWSTPLPMKPSSF
ncbi:hypothetical protein ACFV6D_21630 [Kitasatospora sp. NPDC059812]|uniref:hypothetical protein n=1 Tax=Kitasatospora sp. NPDC059812 TaxID=3346958 RepID=UPI00365E76B5